MIVRTRNDMSFVRHNFTQTRNKLLNKFSPAENHFEKLLTESGLYYRREKGNYRYNTRWCYFDFIYRTTTCMLRLTGEATIVRDKKGSTAKKKE